MSIVVERVQAGAAWLEEHEPGWLHWIDRDRLDLANCARCIGGQLAGVYSSFLWRHGLTHADAISLGFSLPGLGGDYGQLTAAWRELIDTRRSSKSSKVKEGTNEV